MGSFHRCVTSDDVYQVYRRSCSPYMAPGYLRTPGTTFSTLTSIHMARNCTILIWLQSNLMGAAVDLVQVNFI